jgi:hypothetical protein
MGGVETRTGSGRSASEEERGNVLTAVAVDNSPDTTVYPPYSPETPPGLRLVSPKATTVPVNITAKVRDTRGRYLTSAIFHETRHSLSPYTAVYTLAEESRYGLPSARQIYLDANDPTEYTAAVSLLGSWEHWQHLCGTSWFAPIVEQWREELKTRLLSEATKKIIELSGSYESSSALAAAKKLMEVTSPPKRATGRNKTRSDEQSPETHTNPVGRPPKAPVLNQVAPEDTDADLARILELG